MMWTKRARIQRDIEELAKCNATLGQGLTRFSLTAEDRAARTYLKQEMKACGLVVFEDAAGNLVGRREGQLPGAPVVMIGSHFDSVKGGGNFDGPAGVSVALETARVLFERGIKTRYPIEVVAMIEEEGARFNASLYGSRAMVGKIDVAQLQERKDEKGISMFDALKDFGFNPKSCVGPSPTGQREGFSGAPYRAGSNPGGRGAGCRHCQGNCGHSRPENKNHRETGPCRTIPMNLRSDALNMAAKAIAQIAELAIEAGEGTVATVGWIAVKPGGFNIIPGEAEFSVDIRSGKLEHVDTVTRRVGEVLSELTQGTGVTYEIASLMKVAPVQMATDIVNKELAICEKLGLKSRLMLSGAGHDAMVMAGIADVGLLFVPSLAGRRPLSGRMDRL